MVLVLIVAICCGVMVWTGAQWQREGKMWGQITAQREATFLALHYPDFAAYQRFVSVEPLQFRNPNWREDRRWVDVEESWVIEAGRQRDRTRITVSGGGDDDAHVGPIVIEDGGGELNAHYIAKLVAAYKSKGWAYRVVTKGSAKAP